MLKVEELFERAKKYQKWVLRDISFFEALYEVLMEIVYYGGADIEYGGEIYRVRTDTNAVRLILDIYRDAICMKEESNS